MKKTQKTVPACWLSRGLRTLSLSALLGTGCAMAQPSQPMLLTRATTSHAQTEINSALASLALQTPTSSADYCLGPEDLVEITLFNIVGTEGETPRKMEVRVSQQGVITLPLLGDITAAGLTTSALEQVLQERYKKYIRDPHVGIFVKEYHSHQISVIGEVKSPGVFKLSGPKTLIDLLAMAGGVNERAGSQVHLYRQGPAGRESYMIDLYALTHNVEAANLVVQAGDVINLPQAGMFFVDGAVRNPGAFPLNRPYTFTQALSSAGGVDLELAKTSGITIMRHRGPAGVEILPPINLDEIRSGKAADLLIEAEDVIVVPMSTTKYFVRRFISGFSLGQFLYF